MDNYIVVNRADMLEELETAWYEGPSPHWEEASEYGVNKLNCEDYIAVNREKLIKLLGGLSRDASLLRCLENNIGENHNSYESGVAAFVATYGMNYPHHEKALELIEELR